MNKTRIRLLILQQIAHVQKMMIHQQVCQERVGKVDNLVDRQIMLKEMVHRQQIMPMEIDRQIMPMEIDRQIMPMEMVHHQQIMPMEIDRQIMPKEKVHRQTMPMKMVHRQQTMPKEKVELSKGTNSSKLEVKEVEEQRQVEDSKVRGTKEVVKIKVVEELNSSSKVEANNSSKEVEANRSKKAEIKAAEEEHQVVAVHQVEAGES